MDRDLLLRPMRVRDLPHVLHIQYLSHGSGFEESAAVLERKLELAPAYCWVAEDSERLVAYLFSHPWQGYLPPSLHQRLPALPATADVWFVHDLALDPAVHGRGVGSSLFRQARRQARAAGWRRSLLVAIQGADQFWLRQGYHRIESNAALLAGADLAAVYGTGACLMGCALDDAAML